MIYHFMAKVMDCWGFVCFNLYIECMLMEVYQLRKRKLGKFGAGADIVVFVFGLVGA